MNKKICAITIVGIFLLTTIGSMPVLGFEAKKLSTPEAKIDELSVETSTLGETIHGGVFYRIGLQFGPFDYNQVQIQFLNPDLTLIDQTHTDCHGWFFFHNVEIPARYILTFQAYNFKDKTKARYFETNEDCDLDYIH